jgi:hypothetical protein
MAPKRLAADLTREELVKIVTEIQELLWGDDYDDDGNPTAWNHEKEWECADYLGMIAGLLEEFGLGLAHERKDPSNA